MRSSEPLVFTRPRKRELRTERPLLGLAVLIAVVTALTAVTGIGAFVGAEFDSGTIRLFSVTALCILLLVGCTWLQFHNWRLERAMRGLCVTIAHDGITYTSAAGTFSVRWHQVSKVQHVSRQGTVLRVHSRQWGGPVDSWLHMGQLDVPDSKPPMRPEQIDSLVHHFSSGIHQPDRPPSAPLPDGSPAQPVRENHPGTAKLPQ